MSALPELVLYDGTCGLCDRSVQWILRHDGRDRFVFAALQGETGQALLRRHGRDPSALDTVCVVVDRGTERERLLDRSDAALHVAAAAGGAWSLITALRVVPRFLRDAVYHFVARHRYRWFGTVASCSALPGQRRKFLD